MHRARRKTRGWARKLAGLLRSLVLVLALARAAAAAGEHQLATVPPLSADSLLAGGAPVVALNFAGAEARSPLTLERAVRSAAPAAGRPWDGRALDRALKAILASYREIGHLHAEVSGLEVAAAEGGVKLVFLIEEGPTVFLGRVEIVGNDLHGDAEIRELLGLKEGAPFQLHLFHQGVEHLLELYENEGRPFAQIEPRDLHWDEEIRFTLAIHEGQPVSIDAIRVSGNRITRSSVIERISGLEIGEPFAEKRIERAEGRLRRSGLFAQVEPLELAQGADRTRTEVLIRVREGRTNFVNGAIGYAGPEQGLTGLFDLSLGNLAGTGRQGSARWEGRGNGVSLYNLGYAEPWILGSPVTAHFALGRTIQDTLYTESTLVLTGEIEVAPDLKLITGWERETTVQSTGPVRGSERNALVVGGAWDSRDSRSNPTRGLLTAAEMRLARKHLDPVDAEGEGRGADLRFASMLLRVEIESARRIGRSWVTLVRARGEGIASEEEVIPFYELFPLGGARSLRGYREEQFRGAHVELVQIEQRYLLDTEGSRLVGFVDLGYVSTKGTVLATPGEPESIFRIGYGAGLRVNTRIGIVGLDYGLGEGDGPLDGKLHFALETAF